LEQTYLSSLMKLLFDQNLSPRLVPALEDLFPASLHVSTVDLDRADDRTVAAYAHDHGLAIVTKDANFDELRLVLPQAPRVVWIQRGNCSTREIEALLRANAETIRALEHGEDATAVILR